MALYSEFQYGDGVLYGATSLALQFTADVEITYGGARHGGISIAWDVTGLVESIGAVATMIVASPMTPATVPEEGEVVYLDWQTAATPSGSISYYTQAGQWTYFSLFVMGTDRRWRWVSFRLALPVSDWDYSQILPRMLPGAMTSDEQNVASGPSDGNLLLELLGEFGFVLDEIKTQAEALVPFWQPDNIVPQSSPAIARLLDVPYIAELGPIAYRNLLSIKSDDSGLDTIGQKIAAITRWRSRARLSINNMLNVNDSSGERRAGEWYAGSSTLYPLSESYGIYNEVATITLSVNPSISIGDTIRVTGVGSPYDGTFTVLDAYLISNPIPSKSRWYLTYSVPGALNQTKFSVPAGLVSEVPNPVSRVEHTSPPEILTTNDLQKAAFQRFSAGTWTCGQVSGSLYRHVINTQSWPSVSAGFFLKVNSGSSVSVTLSLDTYTLPTDNSATNVPLISLTGLSAASNGTWQWYSTDGVVALNTDAVAVPKIVVSPSGAEVDLDVITIGPAPAGYRPTPRVEAEMVGNRFYDQPELTYNSSIPYDEVKVELSVLNAPEHSSALVHWGDDTVHEIIEWGSLSGTTHDYTTKVIQEEFTRFFITVYDISDPVIAASTSILLGQEFN